jgi:hypothetical protein
MVLKNTWMSYIISIQYSINARPSVLCTNLQHNGFCWSLYNVFCLPSLRIWNPSQIASGWFVNNKRLDTNILAIGLDTLRNIWLRKHICLDCQNYQSQGQYFGIFGLSYKLCAILQLRARFSSSRSAFQPLDSAVHWYYKLN